MKVQENHVLHIGDLPSSATEVDIINMVSSFRKPLHCQILRNKKTGACLPIAAVIVDGSFPIKYRVPQQLKGGHVSITRVNRLEVEERNSRKYTVACTRGLPPNATISEITLLFNGISKPLEILWFSEASGLNKGYCYLVYDNDDAADLIKEALPITLDCHEIEITFTKNTINEVNALRSIMVDAQSKSNSLQESSNGNECIQSEIVEEDQKEDIEGPLYKIEDSLRLTKYRNRCPLLTTKGRDMEFTLNFSLREKKEFEGTDLILPSFVTTYRPCLNKPRIVDKSEDQMHDYMSNSGLLKWKRTIQHSKKKISKKLKVVKLLQECIDLMK